MSSLKNILELATESMELATRSAATIIENHPDDDRGEIKVGDVPTGNCIPSWTGKIDYEELRNDEIVKKLRDRNLMAESILDTNVPDGFEMTF